MYKVPTLDSCTGEWQEKTSRQFQCVFPPISQRPREMSAREWRAGALETGVQTAVEIVKANIPRGAIIKLSIWKNASRRVNGVDTTQIRFFKAESRDGEYWHLKTPTRPSPALHLSDLVLALPTSIDPLLVDSVIIELFTYRTVQIVNPQVTFMQ